MDTLRFLDILGFVVGLVYLVLEYKASIWLWLASVIMPAVDMVLYYKAGLYADFGMAVYYCLAGVYQGKVTVVMLDAIVYREIIEKYNIEAVPEFVLIKAGQEDKVFNSAASEYWTVSDVVLWLQSNGVA